MLFVFADSSVYHSSPGGFPHFSGLPERLFQWKSNPPHPILIKTCKGQFSLTALFPYQRVSESLDQPDSQGLGAEAYSGLLLVGIVFACIQGTATGANVKEFQVTDSPWRVCGQTKLEFGDCAL